VNAEEENLIKFARKKRPSQIPIVKKFVLIFKIARSLYQKMIIAEKFLPKGAGCYPGPGRLGTV